MRDGSLVGAYRSMGVLPHDYDIDMGVLRSECDIMHSDKFHRAANTLGFHLQRVSCDDHFRRFFKKPANTQFSKFDIGTRSTVEWNHWE